MNTKKLVSTLLPVMFGFVIMAFVDLAGIAANYAKEQFSISDLMSKFTAVACFIWFLFFSVPAAIAANKWGRKNLVLVSFVVTVVGTVIPVIFTQSFAGVLVAFCLLGIGNTILQVTLNPLVQDVIGNEGLTGALTIGQALKAGMSFATPFLLPIFATAFGDWRLAFLVYGGLSLVATVWLFFAPVENRIDPNANLSLKGTFALLKDKTILLFFIGILILVGIDVGTSNTIPSLLQEKIEGLDLNGATKWTSLYFGARALAAFAGGVLLLKIKERYFYIASTVLSTAGMLTMIFGNGLAVVVAGIILFGVGYANLFSIIFGLALKHAPDRSNEVSGLLITGVAGGAFIGPILGWVYQATGTYVANEWAMVVLWVYILVLAVLVNKISKSN